MGQHFSNPERAYAERALPDLEVFYMSRADIRESDWTDEAGEPLESGWYWWSCFPGCLPDGEPNGPFATEEEALADARIWCES